MVANETAFRVMAVLLLGLALGLMALGVGWLIVHRVGE